MDASCALQVVKKYCKRRVCLWREYDNLEFCHFVFFLFFFVWTSCWSNVWRVSSLKSHSLCQNSKVAVSHSLTQWRRSGIELPGQLKHDGNTGIFDLEVPQKLKTIFANGNEIWVRLKIYFSSYANSATLCTHLWTEFQTELSDMNFITTSNFLLIHYQKTQIWQIWQSTPRTSRSTPWTRRLATNRNFLE